MMAASRNVGGVVEGLDKAAGDSGAGQQHAGTLAVVEQQHQQSLKSQRQYHDSVQS
jgi:hypothetical protein